MASGNEIFRYGPYGMGLVKNILKTFNLDKTLVGHWYEKRIRPIIGSHDFKTSYGGQFQGYFFISYRLQNTFIILRFYSLGPSDLVENRLLGVMACRRNYGLRHVFKLFGLLIEPIFKQ